MEDYRKLDPDDKMETYNLGVLYIREDEGTLLENVGNVFKHISAECNSNVYKLNEPMQVEIKPVFYYEETNEDVSSK